MPEKTPGRFAVGEIFRKAREAQQLSQTQVAELTRGRPGQISRAMVSLIERGRHLPGLEATVALSRALNVEPMEVFERVDLPSVEPGDLSGFDVDQLVDRAKDCFWAGDYRSAVATHEIILHLLNVEPPADPEKRVATEARVEIHRASALRHLGALAAARAAAERAVNLTEEMPELQTRGYLVLAALYDRRGLRPLARDMASKAVELARGLGPKLQGSAWHEMGTILYAWGKYEEARDAFLKAGVQFREAEDHVYQIHVQGNVGSCLARLGRTDQARRRFLQAVELSRKKQVPASEAFWLVELGRACFEERGYDEADRYAEVALRIAKPRGHQLTVFRAELLRHRISTARDVSNGNRHRLAYLRRLYSGLRDHAGVEEIQWYKANILDHASADSKATEGES